MAMETVRIGAGAVLIRSGKLLLGRRAEQRSYYPGVWDVFGGHVEPGSRLRRHWFGSYAKNLE